MRTSKITRNRLAFTVLEMLVVVAVIAIVAALILPRHNKEKEQAIRIKCVSCLKHVGLSFRIWEGDNNDLTPMQFYTNEIGGMKFADASNSFRYFQVLSNMLSTPELLWCPADGGRKVATNFTSDFDNNHVSYFIGLDANATQPSGLLAGDRNVYNGSALTNGILTLTTNQPLVWTQGIHRDKGNVALADGSVQQLSSSRLRDAVRVSGIPTNRLLFP